MAAESERPPYLNGASARSRLAMYAATSDSVHRTVSEGDVAEKSRLAVQSQPQAVGQIPKLLPIFSTTTSGSVSTTTSAVSSRESSPVRSSSRAASSSYASLGLSRSCKSSPTRSSTNGQSSAAPVPISASPLTPTHPIDTQLPPPAPEPPVNVLSPEKSNMPAWAGNRRTDQASTPPNTSHKRTQLPLEESGKTERNSPRTVTRGPSGQGPSLETVQEMTSNPSTPSTETATKPSTPDDSRLHTIDEDPTPRASRQNIESGSDSGGNRSSKEDKPNATGIGKSSGTVIPKRSMTSLSGARAKPSEGSVRNMIVETETVSSIPQVSLGVGSGDRGNAGRADQGTLRMKPSTETIRPRKEKKKSRRPNALNTGPASTKADIFEAKVASAVDEADVSDSDETFVYESNPPDPYPPRQPRYHSRTPSATSMASQVDQLAGRARGGLRDGAHSVTGKRSMKFTNSEFGTQGNRNGTINPGSGTITPRHQHIGRHGRGGILHAGLFDHEQPHPPQSGMKSPRHFLGHVNRHSRNGNPRSSPNYKTIGNKKGGESFDFDAEGADDERTPLVGARHMNRRAGRRPGSASLRQLEYMERQRGFFSRYGSCAVVLLLLLIITGGAVSFVIAATKTLLDVQVLAIQNVLASEQEIMLDLNVRAVNPNIFPVTIDDTDINIFAKSRYVGTDKFWREHGQDELDQFPRVEQSRKRWQLTQIVRCLGNMECVESARSGLSASKKSKDKDGVDHGTDPIPDPEGDPRSMLLGRVFRFDSPLSFEASPWGQHQSTSMGQIRLARPGNKTEEGGTERWEKVLEHPFELIVRGVIKYQLPLSSHYYSASVSSSVKIVPDEDIHDPEELQNLPNNETVRISFTRTTTPVLRLADADAREHQSGLSQRQFTA
ncbi:uncharacterized protein N7477_004880 [Penicillium maclennaniae]|uniref:uncharacterized protein n=1 Tax=Penicillium maclennaniae TaxID=1343394 RepID=UPI002540319C|nr:uncharacterized protein N7477_004880 [Penicillium maclennaniae]KAJ5674946.1 hypothetical protein N7477_004880 [Penicillium maclennaniae]